MSSEIRSSSALTLSVAQSSSTELSLQNPLFSIDSPGGFPQVLKQQTRAREDIRRNEVASQDARRPKSSPVRQERRDEARQVGGKRLPAGQAAASARESAERPTVSKSSKTATRDEGVIPPQSDTLAQPATQAQTAHPQADSQTFSENDLLPATPVAEAVSVQADVDAALQTQAGKEAQFVSVEPLSVADVTGELSHAQDSAMANGENAESTRMMEMARMAVPLDGVRSSEPQVSNPAVTPTALDKGEPAKNTDTSMQNQGTFVAEAGAESALVDTRPLQSLAVKTRGSLAGVTDTADIAGDPAAGERSTATPATAEPLTANATRSEMKRSGLAEMQSSDQSDTAQTGELESWELGHETTAAEKNAEVRSAFVKQLAADRNGPLKDQLAALAQQIKGADEGEARPQSRKSGAVNDIKPTVFGRTLEQLSHARAETGKPVSTGIQTPVGQREWAGELGQRLVMMVSSKLKSAEIHLNPKDLGPVEVRIRMHDDKAHVVFTSQVPQTREALEQSVPRLREMLDQNGVALGNVDVQDHGAHHSQHHQTSSDNSRGRNVTIADGAEPGDESSLQPARALTLVDYYA